MAIEKANILTMEHDDRGKMFSKSASSRFRCIIATSALVSVVVMILYLNTLHQRNKVSCIPYFL